MLVVITYQRIALENVSRMSVMIFPDWRPSPAHSPSGTSILGAAALVLLLTSCGGPPPGDEPTGADAEDAWTVAAPADPLDRTIAHIYASALSSRDVPTLVVDEPWRGAEGAEEEAGAVESQLPLEIPGLASGEDPEDGSELIIMRTSWLAHYADPEAIDGLTSSPEILDAAEDRMGDPETDSGASAELLDPSAATQPASLAITTVTAEQEDIDTAPDAASESLEAACDGLELGTSSSLAHEVPDGDSPETDPARSVEEVLEADYDCEPESVVVAEDDDLMSQLIRGELDGALVPSTYPGILDHALIALDDTEEAFPEEQFVPVAAAEIAEEAPDVTGEVAQRLDDDAIATLRRLLEGPDALAPAQAAEYWLIEEGLIAEPEDWG